MTELPRRLGVVGAGTMGAGIAQLGVLAGIETVLHDPIADALDKGEQGVRAGLAKGAERGRWSAADAQAAEGRLHTSAHLPGLERCDMVIEAAPERLDLKRELFNELAQTCGPGTVLATNTSSIPITQIAGVVDHPENVVGMHFFNPAPLMKLVEVIAALQTGERALAVTRATGEAMGKHVIDAADGPGFLVNRCGRPFYSESLRLLQERVATHEQIDRICRVGGGFRMGPFELMDLVGIDVGYAVAQSFMELSFGEPRWKPNPLQARMAASGRLGRKTGRGWYDYTADGPYRPEDPEVSLDELERGIGTPGRVLHRIQCCIVNEAAFALGEGVGSADDIDAGVKLGLNWPKGSIELGRELGFENVLATMDELFEHYHEERYRAAPLLRRGELGSTSV
ncbi:MAG: 3-hydroxyacyl-CoA dehydrogenase NAD-binding domain-containing protein [Thermoleophilaceae bacterium]